MATKISESDTMFRIRRFRESKNHEGVERMGMDCYTSAGVQNRNDDSFIAIECHDGRGCLRLGMNGRMTQDTIDFECGDFVLCAVSDGVGSSAYGGEASAMVVSELLYSVEYLVESEDVAKAIVDTVSSISDAIADNLDSGGKATLVGYLEVGGRGYIFNTGDSVAEACRGRWRYRSLEHNASNTSGCDADDPDACRLTEYLGKSEPRVDVDESLACDKVVLCSDGASVLGSLLDREGCRDLVRQAIDSGSTGNVTIVMFGRDC